MWKYIEIAWKGQKKKFEYKLIDTREEEENENKEFIVQDPETEKETMKVGMNDILCKS